VIVRHAVIPAAGLGTRFLPATKAVPKELLPILDTPILQFVVDEAIGAGIEHIVVVTHRDKPAIEAYFAPSPALVAKLRDSGKEQLAERLEAIGRDVQVSFAYQDAARGLGHAVGCAEEIVGERPFAVLLPDEIMGDASLLAQMNGVCASSGGGVVALKQVAHHEVSAYGVVDPAGPVDHNGLVPVRSMVEKPRLDDAPSDLIIIGRYVLTPDVFAEIRRVVPGAIGEIQLTDALRVQAERGPFHGVVSTSARYDTGNPAAWLQAVVDLALADDRYAEDLRLFLKQRLG
jgi:UTP--glucose-1-phosphate uridylyltransferase